MDRKEAVEVLQDLRLDTVAGGRQDEAIRLAIRSLQSSGRYGWLAVLAAYVMPTVFAVVSGLLLWKEVDAGGFVFLALAALTLPRWSK